MNKLDELKIEWLKEDKDPKAKALGLKYVGFGRWKNKIGDLYTKNSAGQFVKSDKPDMKLQDKGKDLKLLKKGLRISGFLSHPHYKSEMLVKPLMKHLHIDQDTAKRLAELKRVAAQDNFHQGNSMDGFGEWFFDKYKDSINKVLSGKLSSSDINKMLDDEEKQYFDRGVKHEADQAIKQLQKVSKRLNDLPSDERDRIKAELRKLLD